MKQILFSSLPDDVKGLYPWGVVFNPVLNLESQGNGLFKARFDVPERYQRFFNDRDKSEINISQLNLLNSK